MDTTYLQFFLVFICALGGVRLIPYLVNTYALLIIGRNSSVPYYGFAGFPGIGTFYVLGATADNYAAFSRNKATHFNILLPLTYLIVMVSTFFFMLTMLNMHVLSTDGHWILPDKGMPMDFYVALAVGVLFGLLFIVSMYYAMYKVFAYTVPGKAGLYAILSILFSFLGFVVLFAIRNKTDRNNFANARFTRR